MLGILLAIIVLLYVLSPYDLIPDFLVGFGWLDDLAILALLWRYFYMYRKKRYRDEYFDHKRQPSYNKNGGRQSSQKEASGSNEHYEKRRATNDPYTVLGIGRAGSPDEIKKAYRRLVKQYHPDKVLHLGEEFKELAERRFKEIQEAYSKIKPE